MDVLKVHAAHLFKAQDRNPGQAGQIMTSLPPEYLRGRTELATIHWSASTEKQYLVEEAGRFLPVTIFPLITKHLNAKAY
ncbi:hypothetical protein [Cupriavidus basilensis]|uniref:hypothetical protein n=1 Tax=Cupriavidus basilensis TaxID=68895 RepID=UPI0020A69F9A|nr:hypothetical protein [Cupriavidus basilensis]MCP3019618.1 hypothetical protein [Cupriavidus basilensis]